MEAADKLPQSSRRRIYLLRHGNVRYFDRQSPPPSPDLVPLDDEGRQQAELTGRELADVPFDRVITSDLRRCVETANLVLGDRALPVQTQPRIREIQPGRMRGLSLPDAEKAFLGAFHGTLAWDDQFLGGETYRSLWDRVRGWFQEILTEPGWRCLLVVAHGGVNRALLAAALESDLRIFSAFEQDPCCINILDVDDAQRCLVRLVNHTAYAPAKLGLELTTMERLYHDYCRWRG